MLGIAQRSWRILNPNTRGAKMDFCTKCRSVALFPMTTLKRPAAKFVLLTINWLAWGGLMAACSSGGASGAPSNSTAPALTNVTVVLSSDANDQFTDFGAVLQSITLTNRSGKSVTLLSQPMGAEFIHLNSLV